MNTNDKACEICKNTEYNLAYDRNYSYNKETDIMYDKICFMCWGLLHTYSCNKFTDYITEHSYDKKSCMFCKDMPFSELNSYHPISSSGEKILSYRKYVMIPTKICCDRCFATIQFTDSIKDANYDND